MEVKDNEGIRPEVRRENDAAADQAREIDVMDCKASEGVDVKESDTQKRDLKERSVNIDDPTKGTSNLGDCATNKKNTVPDHLQDHDDKSGKNHKDKIINRRIGETQRVKIPKCFCNNRG